MSQKEKAFITTIYLTQENGKFWHQSDLNRSRVLGKFTKFIRFVGEGTLLDLLKYVETNGENGVKKLKQFLLEG